MRSVASVLGLIVLPCFAQAQVRLIVGDEVRVQRRLVLTDTKIEAAKRIRATFLAYAYDTLIVVQHPDTIRIARSEIVHVDVARGARRPFAEYGSVGLFAGAVLGGFVGIMNMEDGTVSTNGGSVLSSIVLGAALGGTIGLVVARTPRTTWVRLTPR